MYYGKDYIEKEIRRIKEKTRIKKSTIVLAFIPFIISAVIVNILSKNTDKILPSWVASLPLYTILFTIAVGFRAIKRKVKGEIQIKELRARRMHLNGNYESKIKILSTYNPKYKYNKIPYFLFYFLMLITSLMVLSFFRGEGSYSFYRFIILAWFVFFIFLVGYISRFNKNKMIVQGPKKVKKAIEKIFHPTEVYGKSIDMIFESNLYPIFKNKVLLKSSGDSYFRYDTLYDTYDVYNYYPTYRLSDCNMNIYEIYGEIYYNRVKEKSILFVFDNQSFKKEFKILNQEFYADNLEKLKELYKIESNDYSLEKESIDILDKIFKSDIVDIYVGNGKVYIKKYIPRFVTEQDIKSYTYDLELYRKFIKTLK